MRNETRSVWRRWGILVVVGIGVWLLDFWPVFSSVKRGAEVGLQPVRLVGVNFGDRGRGLVGALGSIRSTHRRILDLERRVAELSVTAAQVERVMAENEAWRRLSAAPSLAGRRTVLPARVVGKGDVWLLDIGSESGVKGEEAVVSEEGVLVGRVAEVGAFVSRVRLTTHPKTTLAVETQAGTPGILTGKGETVEFARVLQEHSLEVGDKLLTTGGEGNLPAGLVVGTVESIESAPAAVYKKARVEPLFDEGTRVVFIITGGGT